MDVRWSIIGERLDLHRGWSLEPFHGIAVRFPVPSSVLLLGITSHKLDSLDAGVRIREMDIHSSQTGFLQHLVTTWNFRKQFCGRWGHFVDRPPTLLISISSQSRVSFPHPKSSWRLEDVWSRIHLRKYCLKLSYCIASFLSYCIASFSSHCIASFYFIAVNFALL